MIARRAPPEPVDHVVLIVGFPGAGKTFMLQFLERRHRLLGCPFVVHDRLGHWQAIPRGWDLVPDPKDPKHERMVLVKRRGAAARTVVRCAEPEEAALVAIKLAPCTLLLDEAALAFPAQGWAPKRSPALNEILKVGRQASAVGPFARRGGVSLLMAAQRPADVTPAVKTFTNRLYVGQYPSLATNDLDWLTDATKDPELARKVEALDFARFEVYYPVG